MFDYHYPSLELNLDKVWRLGGGGGRPGEEMPSHCGEANVSCSGFLLLKPLLDAGLPGSEGHFHELFGDKGFILPQRIRAIMDRKRKEKGVNYSQKIQTFLDSFSTITN